LADKAKAGGAILITVNYVLTLIKYTNVPPLVGNVERMRPLAC